MTNDGFGDEGGKGGKGGGKGRLGVRRTRWKIERSRREKKDMLLFSYTSARRHWASRDHLVQKSCLYIYIALMHVYVFITCIVGDEERSDVGHVRTPCNTKSKFGSKQRDQNFGSGGREKQSF